MSFWNRAATFGFQLPRLDQEGLEFFPESACKVMSGQRLLRNILAQCQELSSTRYAAAKKPHLSVILPGEHPASRVYVEHKQKRFAEAGFSSQVIWVPEEDCHFDHLAELIDELNANPDVDGILLQLPLPGRLDPTPLLDRILPEKDVDGFHIQNTGCLASGRYHGLLPCTPFGIFALLHAYGVQVGGQNVTVVGRSNLVGKPAALLALNARATVTVVHKGTADVPYFTRSADVLIVAAGSHHLIRSGAVKAGAVVIDVGIHRTAEGKIQGDVHPEVAQVASALTPVPGGVGPMTIGMLCVNTAIACWSRRS